ncbi:hypothetical protein J6590_023201 [Homalodisca vitripennis]|nr:hypothetical protein J6590_023201 [Homalodisca vitripennis]
MTDCIINPSSVDCPPHRNPGIRNLFEAWHLLCPSSQATGLCKAAIKRNVGYSRYSTRSSVLIIMLLSKT